MTEYGGKYGQEGEEKRGPAVDVGEEEVVDVDTTLGSKEKVNKEYGTQNSEGEDWLER